MMKTINCPLHGFIDITPRMQKIIDTIEFKRLHDLRQLGVSYMVYPSANHTRFEHSLGVSYLARQLMESLQKHQPELEIDDNTIELVQIAGLLHDIGHGPFSHLFDDYIIKPGDPEHEERGIKMIVRIIKAYDIPITDEEKQMIIDMIQPPDDKKENYLYQIIANKQCSIDVDKIDYIQRDSFHLGFGLNDRYERLITMCRVVDFNGNKVLSWPTKLQDEIVLLFRTRYRLHKNVYNHHTVKACEYLVTDLIKSHTDVDFKLYYNLIRYTDSFILFSKNTEQQSILTKIMRRQLPKLIGEKIVNKENMTIIKKHFEDFVKILNKYHIINRGVMQLKIGFISGNGENPLNNVVYYEKNKEPSKITEYDSFIVPKNCQEYIFRIYYEPKNSDQEKSCLELWKHFCNDYPILK